jgi:hypothetical protein
MKSIISINKPFTTLFAIILFLLTYSCKTSVSEPKSFQGEEEAVDLANQMFGAIGGMEAWCELKSLYIKAEHTEPQMSIPYQSEIWRGVDRFELVIEQQNDSFHVKGVVNELGGTIRYYDKRDTSRILTNEQLKDWKFDHNHNIYVLLHDLGCNPGNYNARIDVNGRLAFYQDSIFLTSFGLDDQLRPYLFYKPNPDGSVSGSIFNYWGTDGGLIHSAGGHPLDSNFMYRTEVWQPATTPLKEMFGEEIFDLQ